MKWVVRPGDGATVGEVLARAGADATAVVEGRVFVGRRRAKRASERVAIGEVVHVAAARRPGRDDVSLLAEAGDLVAADKPAGIPTIPDHAGSSHALVAAVARRLGVDAGRLHPTSRLDRDVSGVVVFALTAAARERLTAARASGLYERRYVAIAARAPRGESLLAVSPVTGRTHQIRVHAAHARAPLLGDRAYGGPSRVTLPSGRVMQPARIALHAARVVVPAEDGTSLVVASPIPPALLELWSALGGDPAAWEVSTSCALP
jgi:23S rRNA pseudouridine1911/1915/1917 synthase